MNIKEIEKARLALKHAGAPADRDQLRSTLISRISNDVEVLQQNKNAIGKDYRRQLERWRTEDVPENVQISSIPGDAHDSRLYKTTAVFALLSEAALAAWIFHRLGIAWWFGVLTAIFITFTLHGVFLQIFDNPERPKEAIHRVRRIAAIPAIIGFLIALGLAMLARYVYGAVAVALLPLFSLSLWLGTISLLVLAASLFTVAHLRGWSLRYDTQYRKLDEEERASSSFLKEIQGEASKAAAPPPAKSSQAPPPLPAAKPTDGRGAAISAILLLTIALCFNAGCSTGAAPAEATTAPSFIIEAGGTQAPARSSPAALHVMIDWSGSCVRAALEESWSNLEGQLPGLIESRRIDHLTLWSFDEDGWCPKRLKEISLPVFEPPGQAKATAGEWDSFANIRDALRESEDREWLGRRKAEEDRYRRAVVEALNQLESASILPELGYETKQSDIVGLLKRISQSREQVPQIFIVVTDLADTRYKELPSIPAPEGQVRVTVVLVPAQPKDALLTIGKPLAGPDQFELRSRQLREAAPWAAAVPYFSQNLVASFSAKTTEKVHTSP